MVLKKWRKSIYTLAAQICGITNEVGTPIKNKKAHFEDKSPKNLYTISNAAQKIERGLFKKNALKRIRKIPY